MWCFCLQQLFDVNSSGMVGRVVEQVGEVFKQNQRFKGESNVMRKPISTNSHELPPADGVSSSAGMTNQSMWLSVLRKSFESYPLISGIYGMDCYYYI